MRDDFTAKTKDVIARRAGYRCSNPTCRKGTVRADPTNPDKAINQGVASHITAASANGPRYDPTLTSEQRRSVENGLWLCQSCGTLVDASPEAWTVEGLRKWKAFAETAAARDARSNNDDIGETITKIDGAHRAVIAIATQWMTSTYRLPYWTTTPGYGEMDEEEKNRVFWEEDQKRSELSGQIKGAYHTQVMPLVREVLTRCEVILGSENPALVKAQLQSRHSGTNSLSMFEFADHLQVLRSILLLR